MKRYPQCALHLLGAVASLALLTPGCASDADTPSAAPATTAANAREASPAGDTTPPHRAGAALRPARSHVGVRSAPLPATSRALNAPAAGPGSFLLAASGEVLAKLGYPFDPNGDPVFVDGWSVRFNRLLVSIGSATISEGPDTDPNDPFKTGRAVARATGPWIVDVASPTNAIPGIGDPGVQAIPFAAIANQNLIGGAPFQSNTRYAFTFETVAAFRQATLVNLADPSDADFLYMVRKRFAVLYVGTATFDGDKNGNACSVGATSYDFSKLPRAFNFRIGFASPTSYVNCQNSEFPAGTAPGEEFERGIRVDPAASVLVQVTAHTDHPFWDSFVEDSPLRLDQLAARLVGRAASSEPPTVTADDLAYVPFQPVVDAAGGALPWRNCTSSPANNQAGPSLVFNPGTVPVTSTRDPQVGLRDYRDFMLFSQSIQGHLNADGLCAVSRNYPSPGGGPFPPR